MLSLKLTKKRLRILQGIALTFSVVGMTVFVSNGKPIFAVVIGGIGFGILSFIPIGIILLLYWAVSEPKPTTSSKKTA